MNDAQYKEPMEPNGLGSMRIGSHLSINGSFSKVSRRQPTPIVYTRLVDNPSSAAAQYVDSKNVKSDSQESMMRWSTCDITSARAMKESSARRGVSNSNEPSVGQISGGGVAAKNVKFFLSQFQPCMLLTSLGRLLSKFAPQKFRLCAR